MSGTGHALRLLGTSLAASGGLATVVAHRYTACPVLPWSPPVDALRATVAEPLFLTSFGTLLIVLLAARAVVDRFGVGVPAAATRRSSRGDRSVGRTTRAVHRGEPLALGAALPAMAPFLDPASFGCTAGPLAFLGLTLGALALLRDPGWGRRGDVGGRSSGSVPGPADDAVVGIRDTGPQGWILGATATLLVLVLLPTWPQPAGDEAQYLVTAHSLAFDGDLHVGDDFADGEYRAFHRGFLWPHVRIGADGTSRYSMHGVGYALLLAPFYRLGSLAGGGPWLYGVPRAAMALLYGLFVALLYRLIAALADRRAARRGVLAGCFLGPLLFAPTVLFPEVPAMLLAVAAFLGLHRARGLPALVGAAAMLAMMPWLGIKYLPLAAGVALAGTWARPRRGGPGPATRAAVLGGAFLLTLGLHGAYTWSLYGSLSPASVYLGTPGAGEMLPAFGDRWLEYLYGWPEAVRMGLGYLIDQKEGLLAVGPQFLLVAAGLPWLWRRRRTAVALALPFVAHLLVYAVSQVPGGQSPPVRPLMPVLWTLTVPLGVALALPPGRRVLDLARGAGVMLATALTVVYCGHPELLPHDFPVRASRLLRYFSPEGAGLWAGFPRLINVADVDPWTHGAWIVGLALVTAWLVAAGSAAELEGEGAGSRAAEGDGNVRRGHDRGRNGRRGSVRAIAAGCAILLAGVGLWRQVTVVVSDLHRGGSIGHGFEAFAPATLPERVWVEPTGVWVAPGEARSLVLLHHRPVRRLRVALSTLVRSRTRMRLQRFETSDIIAPGRTRRAEIEPGPAWRWRDRYAYRLILRAVDGEAPANLGPSDDRRVLGLRLRMIDVERREKPS